MFVFRFSVGFLTTKPPFFLDKPDSGEPEAKKPKKKSKAPGLVCVLQAVFRLVSVIGSELRGAWDWGSFLRFLQQQDNIERW